MQLPSIARVVHFYPSGSDKPQAALIIDVEPLDGDRHGISVVACNAFGTWSTFHAVPYVDSDLGPKGRADAGGNSWCWPPRV